MSITVFSFITAILWFNLYIVIIALIRRRNNFLIQFSIVPLTLLTVACIFRLIFFFEFSSTVIIPSEIIFPTIVNFFTLLIFTAFDGSVVIHIYDVLFAVWVVGSIYNLRKYIFELVQLNNLADTIHETKDVRIISCMEEIIAKGQKAQKVKIIQTKEIDIPMVVGFFKPIIFLPEICFSNYELKNILLHEWTHFLHKDIWIKLIMYLICSVFWWNPFVHLLKNEINHLLEIRCDVSITSEMDEKGRIRYLESISKVIKSARRKNFQHNIPVNSTALVSINKAKKIEQRFHLVLEYSTKEKRRTFSVFLLYCLILLSLFTSYKFTMQPRYFPTVESGYEETFIISPDNSFLVFNGDGTYSLYTNGEYKCNVNHVDEEPFLSLPIK